VRVFGSVARGEATPESDIDLLVDYDLEKITPWFPGGLLLDLEQLLNRKVDIAERGYVERTHSRARFAGSCTAMRREAQRLVRVDRSVTTPTSPSERNVILSHHSAP